MKNKARLTSPVCVHHQSNLPLLVPLLKLLSIHLDSRRMSEEEMMSDDEMFDGRVSLRRDLSI